MWTGSGGGGELCDVDQNFFTLNLPEPRDSSSRISALTCDFDLVLHEMTEYDCSDDDVIDDDVIDEDVDDDEYSYEEVDSYEEVEVLEDLAHDIPKMTRELSPSRSSLLSSNLDFIMESGEEFEEVVVEEFEEEEVEDEDEEEKKESATSDDLTGNSDRQPPLGDTTFVVSTPIGTSTTAKEEEENNKEEDPERDTKEEEHLHQNPIERGKEAMEQPILGKVSLTGAAKNDNDGNPSGIASSYLDIQDEKQDCNPMALSPEEEETSETQTRDVKSEETEDANKALSPTNNQIIAEEEEDALAKDKTELVPEEPKEQIEETNTTPSLSYQIVTEEEEEASSSGQGQPATLEEKASVEVETAPEEPKEHETNEKKSKRRSSKKVSKAKSNKKKGEDDEDESEDMLGKDISKQKSKKKVRDDEKPTKSGGSKNSQVSKRKLKLDEITDQDQSNFDSKGMLDDHVSKEKSNKNVGDDDKLTKSKGSESSRALTRKSKTKANEDEKPRRARSNSPRRRSTLRTKADESDEALKKTPRRASKNLTNDEKLTSPSKRRSSKRKSVKAVEEFDGDASFSRTMTLARMLGMVDSEDEQEPSAKGTEATSPSADAKSPSRSSRQSITDMMSPGSEQSPRRRSSAVISPPFAKAPSRRSTKSRATKKRTDTDEFDGDASFSRTFSLAKSLSHINFDQLGLGGDNERTSLSPDAKSTSRSSTRQIITDMISPGSEKSPRRMSDKSRATQVKAGTGEFDGEASFSRTLSLAKSLSHIDYDHPGLRGNDKRTSSSPDAKSPSRSSRQAITDMISPGSEKSSIRISSAVKAAMSPPFAKSPTRRSTKSRTTKEKAGSGEFDGEASFSRTLSLSKSLSHIDFDDSGLGEDSKRDYNIVRKKYNKVAKMLQDLREKYGEDKVMRRPAYEQYLVKQQQYLEELEDTEKWQAEKGDK